MVSAEKLRLLSEFARYVDASPAAVRLIGDAFNLGEVEMLAHRCGYTQITAELLEDAAGLLSRDDWVWNENGQRLSDHIFMMALALILQPRKLDVSLRQIADDIGFTSSEVRDFCRFAQGHQ
ncbi:hypothetical protein [Synechococcus sp. BA-132 BA5]|uniref:hypothetical protein n=1 Tax=Synechococcus sp. BA-132 BA5 TaxID=3110252 RepID=UPI002B1F6643|nr:hypothetical protein [Synechococcus sp. BA-132 BA5]MEA5414091.1 hypothetical protein [Synechococcus sp. BA-132 BA5]